jgi:hypothetical protein
LADGLLLALDPGVLVAMVDELPPPPPQPMQTDATSAAMIASFLFRVPLKGTSAADERRRRRSAMEQSAWHPLWRVTIWAQHAARPTPLRCGAAQELLRISD